MRAPSFVAQRGLGIGHYVAHRTRHTSATNLLRNGAYLTHVKRYLGQVSEKMAEHYVHLANTGPRLEDALNAVRVAGPGASEPGLLLSGSEPMTREQAGALVRSPTRQPRPMALGRRCPLAPGGPGQCLRRRSSPDTGRETGGARQPPRRPHHQRDRVRERPHPAGGRGPWAPPERDSRPEVRPHGDHVSGPHWQGTSPLDHALEDRTQRLRHHLRRPALRSLSVTPTTLDSRSIDRPAPGHSRKVRWNIWSAALIWCDAPSVSRWRHGNENLPASAA